MDPIIQLENVSVRRDLPILSNVNWTMLPGENWVILGANGSGKTSLLQAMHGFLTASSGTIRVCGQRYGEADWHALRGRIGMVSSGVAQQIEPNELAIEVVSSGLRNILNTWVEPSEEDREAARRMMKRIGCQTLEDRPWCVLSLGERQRLMIARALMAAPDLLILDEPCAGLDPVARETFLSFLERLSTQRHAPSMVFVTHHVEEIRPIMTHVLLLRKGRVVTAGPIRSHLTSATISKAFRTELELRRNKAGYRLKLGKLRRRIG